MLTSAVPDIMHDVLEGMLQYETKLVLLHMTQYFNIKCLNHLITCVNLGYMEASSRPTEISLNDDKLKQNGKIHLHNVGVCTTIGTNDHTASQMWLLGRLLPILVGQYIPEHWCNYLLLLDIVDIMFARRITEDTPGVLHHLIEEHHSNFTRLYPERSVIPKMHFMIHVPRIMLTL